ncbi:PspC domain-containing protein [Luteococcus japonicus]|uniref:PspC domain protein n=1 Tax=Luteococcus japonicus LSP_Lj1 TaxID=1255658 RepID=A0A1R4IXD4_9ACTN|nr:PspC domain-containing protein [Luteococcus japonicus]SJN24571.1 PspC domain protein [Luteococcus japonicus LSP_Lj1]
METSQLPVAPEEGLAALRRSRDDAAIAGVCFSLAQHLRVDPLLVRLAAVILALSSGFGVLVYAAAWFLLPQQGATRSLAQQWFPQLDAWPLRRQAKVALGTCLAACVLLAQIGGGSIGPGLVLLLLVVMARRWNAPSATPADPSPAPSTAPLTAGPQYVNAITAWQRRLDEVGLQPHPATMVRPLSATPAPVAPAPVATAPVPSAPAAAAWADDATPTRIRPRRSWLLGILLLVAAGLAAAVVPTEGVPEPRLFQHAAGLAVLACGLLLSWLLNLPRPRLAVLAGLLVVASALTPTPSSLHPIDVAWTSATQIPSEPVRVVATEARYDLSGMDLSGISAPRRLALDAKAADVEVIVPRGAVVRVDYHLRAADLEIDGEGERFTQDGGRDGTWSSHPNRSPDLVLDLTLVAASGKVSHG